MGRTQLDLNPFRRFGSFGPVYQIIEELKDLPNGDKLLKIRVVETGEEAEYKLSDSISDPEAD